MDETDYIPLTPSLAEPRLCCKKDRAQQPGYKYSGHTLVRKTRSNLITVLPCIKKSDDKVVGIDT